MSKAAILVLEDDALIAMDIEMTLVDAGYETVWVHTNSASALDQIAREAPGAALLDFNLGQGKVSLPVAQELKERGIPFVFLTGYTDATVSLPERLGDRRRIAKPFQAQELVQAVGEML